jgi:hypothetical protein
MVRPDMLPAVATAVRTYAEESREVIIMDFWDIIAAQLAELRNAATADDVIRILGGAEGASAGDAFFGGSGGDDSMMEALGEAGWVTTWAEASYYYVMRAPNGDVITYCEGDVYRGDVAFRE